MYKVKKLKNNLTLITIPVKGTEATTVMVMVPIGSRYETARLSGVSHFIEHMVFKGTKKRPHSLNISEELEAEGADYNAFTGKDYTSFYVKIAAKEQERAYDILSDMLFNSEFKAEDLDKERGVITEELRMYEDNPTMAIDALFDSLIFGDHPLGWEIGGTVKTVKEVAREELQGYYRAAYRPENMVLVVAGKIEEVKLKKFLKYFTNIERTTSTKKILNAKNYLSFKWPKQLPALKERVKVSTRKVDQSHLILGFPGLSNNHPDRYAQALMLRILGGGMSSRLFQEVRVKRGLAYMIGAGTSSFRETGTVQVQAGLDSKRLAEALAVIKTELERLTKELVSVKELQDSKTNFTGRFSLAMEDSSSQADWFARQFWFAPKMETHQDVLKKINRVTREDIKRVAKKLLVWDKLHVALVGPTTKEELIKALPKV